MHKSLDPTLSRYWAGLDILERLVEPRSELTTKELAAILATKSVTGVGAALSGTRQALRDRGIRFDEAAIKRSVRERTVWSQGPRIHQAPENAFCRAVTGAPRDCGSRMRDPYGPCSPPEALVECFLATTLKTAPPAPPATQRDLPYPPAATS